MKIDFEKFETKEALAKFLKASPEIPVRTSAEVDKYIRANVPKESYYQKKIIEKIRSMFPTAFVWKIQQGAYSRQGVPDICAIIHGCYYGFEVKRPFLGVLSGIQLKTIEDIQRAGGKAYVVTYTSEVERILAPEKEAAG